MDCNHSAWKFYHLFSLYCEAYARCKYVDWMRFNRAFCKSIPCKICKIHFTTILNESQTSELPYMNSFEGSVYLHNKVNDRVRKPHFSLSDANKKYQQKSITYLTIAINEYSVILLKYVKNKTITRSEADSLFTYISQFL